jgi:hypothetical protein
MLGNWIAILPPIQANGEATANSGRGIFLRKIQGKCSRISSEFPCFNEPSVICDS